MLFRSIAREILYSIRADAVPEVLRRDVLELMRFVENHVAARWNDLAVRVLPDRRIRAYKVMVDDDDVGYALVVSLRLTRGFVLDEL